MNCLKTVLFVITNYLHFCLQVSMMTYFHLSFLKLLLAITRLLIRIFRILFYFFGQKKIQNRNLTFFVYIFEILLVQALSSLSANSHFDLTFSVSVSQDSAFCVKKSKQQSKNLEKNLVKSRCAKKSSDDY